MIDWPSSLGPQPEADKVYRDYRIGCSQHGFAVVHGAILAILADAMRASLIGRLEGTLALCRELNGHVFAAERARAEDARDHEGDMALLRAQVTELQAQVERLKVCGNCGRNSDIGAVSGLVWKCLTDKRAEGRPSHVYDACHFTPSKWTERGQT